MQSFEEKFYQKVQQVENLQKRMKCLEQISRKLGEIEQQTQQLTIMSLAKIKTLKLPVTIAILDEIKVNLAVAEVHMKEFNKNFTALQKNRQLEETCNKEAQLLLQNFDDVE